MVIQATFRELELLKTTLIKLRFDKDSPLMKGCSSIGCEKCPLHIESVYFTGCVANVLGDLK